MTACPCGSTKDYSACCEVFISGKQQAPTPETLMRSRYTAYTQANIDYIAYTMQGPAAKKFNAEDAFAWAKSIEWLGLEIVSASTEDNKGHVEFIARFKQDNQQRILHELSEFQLENNQWFYVDGSDPRVPRSTPFSKVGRNEPCLCGSGKKHKKCCGNITA